MKTFVTAIIASVMATSVAFAQGAADRSADALNAQQLESLRPRVATPAPVPAAAPASQASAVRLNGLYAGLTTGYGGAHWDSGQWSTGVAIGYELNKYLAVEASADYVFGRGNHEAGQTVFVNAIAGYPIGRVTPYALAGTGWGFNGAGDHHKATQSLWNVGGGLAVNLNRNWQLDGRYRYVEAWDGNRAAEQLVGVGVNYKF